MPEIIKLTVVTCKISDHSADIFKVTYLIMFSGIQIGTIYQGKCFVCISQHTLFDFPVILKNCADAKFLLTGTGTHKIKTGDILLHLIAGLTACIGSRFTIMHTTQYNKFDVPEF